MGKRILITGHNGYIGSVMVPLFLESGYQVMGLDAELFAVCTFIPDTVRVPTLHKDIRDLQPGDLEGFEAIVHLAALSNDPIGNLNSAWTNEINFHASVRLAKLAKAAGARRFLFSSSCIMYGQSEMDWVTEECPLDPKTEYARSKVKAEQAISALADSGFSPTFLRNGTIYGVSPRMRFDTVLNNLMGMAVATGKVVLHGDGRPWRPVVHVEDMARAFMHVLEAPIEIVHNQAFNNGNNDLNHQMMELAEVVAGIVPGCEVKRLASPDADQRTYKADFSKFSRSFPDFKFKRNIREGAQELYDMFKRIGLTDERFTDPQFTRLKWLRYLLDTGRLDASLRWNHTSANAR